MLHIILFASTILQTDFTAIPRNDLSRDNSYTKPNNIFGILGRQNNFLLEQFNEWNVKSNSNANIGDIVLNKNANLPPQIWKMGKIIILLPEPVSITRVVKLQTNECEIIWPLHNLCLLSVSK